MIRDHGTALVNPSYPIPGHRPQDHYRDYPNSDTDVGPRTIPSQVFKLGCAFDRMTAV